MDIIQLIEKEGARNLRFVVPMRKTEGYILGMFRSLSSEKDYPHNCIITEDPKITRYKVKDNYKITLMSLEDGQYEHFYVMDLNSLIHKGIIKVEVKPAFLEV